MSRCPKLEAILAAKHHFETGPPEEQAQLRARLDGLLQQALTESGRAGLTVRQLEDSLRDVYREYVRAMRRAERERLSRLR
jgi:hypothetical protein